jgi:hypothetical protein
MSGWWRCGGSLVMVAVTALGAFGADAAKPLQIYFIDLAGAVGNATLLISPSGESMLLDTGPSFTVKRVVEVLKHVGVKQLDYLVVTHYHADHYGATAEIAAQIPIVHFLDHGEGVELGQSDAWWKERRGPWFREGMGKLYDESHKRYVREREKGRHSIVRAGDVLPIKGIEVRAVCAGGQVLAKPLPGAGQPSPPGADLTKRRDDDAEDAQSIGVLVSLGAFRFIYLGDLTWNKENELFAPQNKVGTVDAYVITHHAQSFPKAMGDYYHGLSACPPAEVHGLRPRVAILSLGSRGHRQGDAVAMETVRRSPGLEDVWQTAFVTEGGEKGHNAPPDFCANLNEPGNPVRFLQLTAHADGSFTMRNSRNGFTKTYPAREEVGLPKIRDIDYTFRGRGAEWGRGQQKSCRTGLGTFRCPFCRWAGDRTGRRSRSWCGLLSRTR